MPKQKDERTLKLIEGYIPLRNEGHSNTEIAKMFNVSNWTLYHALDEIAANAGVTREKLLEKPFIADHSGRNFTPVKPVDWKELIAHFDAAVTEVAALEEGIEQVIRKLDSAPTLENEEEVK